MPSTKNFRNGTFEVLNLKMFKIYLKCVVIVYTVSVSVFRFIALTEELLFKRCNVECLEHIVVSDVTLLFKLPFYSILDSFVLFLFHSFSASA